MPFSLTDFILELKTCLVVATDCTASPRSLGNQMARKNMVVCDQIPSDPANFRHVIHLQFAGGAFRNSTLRPDHESRPPVGLPLHARETLGPPPLFRSDPHVGDHPGLATPTLHRRLRRRLPSISISPPERGDRSIDPPPPTAGQPSPAKKRATSTVLPKAAAPGDLVSRVKPEIASTHRREAGGNWRRPWAWPPPTTSPCRSAAESRREEGDRSAGRRRPSHLRRSVH
jgi:hypothetical protein